MPSRDPIDAKANAWMKPRRKPGSSPPLAGPLLRLARRIGVRPESLAARYPEDTVRRLKYPVRERPGERPGSIVYEHDLGIRDV